MDTNREPTQADHNKAMADAEYDAGGVPNIPVVGIRCALRGRKRVHELLREWAETLEPAGRATALGLLELPIEERDSYPTNRFTLIDERGETVFVGNVSKETLTIAPGGAIA